MEISEQKLKEFETMFKQDNPGLEINREQLLALAQKTLSAVALVYGDPNDSEDLPL